MTVPVFGDFLDAASGHIAAAVAYPGALTGAERCGVVRELDRMVSTLARYLGDLPLPDEFSLGATASPAAEARAALDARIALRRAAQSLRPGAVAVRGIRASTSQPAAGHLAAAATCLAAGRDLLHTQIAGPPPGAEGSPSAWAKALASTPVTHALISEIGRLAAQLAPWISRAALEGQASPAMPALAGLALHSAGRWLWIAGASVEAALRRQPSPPEGRLILTAIPANLPPPSRPITGQETLPELCDAVTVTAERLRQASVTFTRRAHWSAQATSQSWRRDALASAITGHGSELILRGLARRAAELGMSPAAVTQLRHAAESLRRAWTAWRAVTGEWDTPSTGLDRPKGLSPVAAEAGGLVLRIGRIAHRNPRWTTACSDASRFRDPAELAPAIADLPTVAAAVHHATDAITHIAVQDSHCVHRAFAEGRLYIPRRMLMHALAYFIEAGWPRWAPNSIASVHCQSKPAEYVLLSVSPKRVGRGRVRNPAVDTHGGWNANDVITRQISAHLSAVISAWISA